LLRLDLHQLRRLGTEAAQLTTLGHILVHPLHGPIEPLAPLFLSPSRQWAIARKNQSLLSPPLRSCMDFSSAATASFQLPAL
jgi:hypothetical protein